MTPANLSFNGLLSNVLLEFSSSPLLLCTHQREDERFSTGWMECFEWRLKNEFPCYEIWTGQCIEMRMCRERKALGHFGRQPKNMKYARFIFRGVFHSKTFTYEIYAFVDPVFWKLSEYLIESIKKQ